MDRGRSKRTRTPDHAAAASGGSAPSSLTRSISPPPKKTRTLVQEQLQETIQEPVQEQSREQSREPARELSQTGRLFKSPFQLTSIEAAPSATNIDSLSLGDIIGDPLIKECWEFNYLHDIDFLMGNFDQDVRHLVKVHVVHGFWKSDDPNRVALQEQVARHKNVELHSAYLPEMFGTHHSKMIILLRHDDTAQVIIHTANMIARDWSNMTQAVWRSPTLPLIQKPNLKLDEDIEPPVGSGSRFKRDLLNYLKAYNDKRPVCKQIAESLAQHDFSAVKGSLIASVPGRHDTKKLSDTQWGWSAMRSALRRVPVSQDGKSELVAQISSIATLGPTDSWLRGVFFDALLSAKQPSRQRPEFRVVFPTPDEIRKSLAGYGSGASIHTKIQSPQQAKQLEYLRPLFCHWANDSENGKKLPEGTKVRDAGRRRAAPHIKTYIRYAADATTIDWALLTSANLSKQAWGEGARPSGEMRVSSYEIGVLVWPALYGEDAVMVPTFRKDEPSDAELDQGRTVVGLRMPYNLPLQRYSQGEKPWVATLGYQERDWMGQAWHQG